MAFLSVPVVLSSACSSVLFALYVWCNGNNLSGSDLDAWTSSKALLNVMMLLGGCQSFWSISMSFLSIPVVLHMLSIACCIRCNGSVPQTDAVDGTAVNIYCPPW